MTLFFFRSSITPVLTLLISAFFNPLFSARTPNSSVTIDCPPDISVGVYGTSCSATVLLPVPTVHLQGCSSNPILKVSSSFGQGLGPHSNVPSGTYQIVYQVISLCGDTATCNTTLKVVDMKKPVAVLNTALYSNLDSDGTVRVEAWQCNQSSYDNCTRASDLRYSFSDAQTDTVRVFTCAHVGMNNLNVWVWDETGNYTIKSTKIGVLDTYGFCDDESLGGKIRTIDGKPVNGVAIKAQSSTAIEHLTTNSNGNFFFQGIASQGDYRVTPKKDDDALNGVNSYDLFLLKQHLLGTMLFSNPIQSVAADVNKDKIVSDTDIKELQDVILGIKPKFQNNTSWRFIDEKFNFSTTKPPLEQVFPEHIVLNTQPGKTYGDFIAVKTGDINGDAKTRDFTEEIAERSLASEPTFWVERLGNGLISIRFDLSDNIVAFDCILNFERFIDDFKMVNTGGKNFKAALFSSNQLKISWYHTDGAQIHQPSIFIYLTSDATTPLQDLVSLDVASNKAFGKGDIMYRSNLKFANANTAAAEMPDVIRAFPNTPNPFMEFTLLPFKIIQESDVNIKIFDMEGSLVHTINGHYGAGEHRVLLMRDALPNPGIYTCRYETHHGTATRKLMMF